MPALMETLRNIGNRSLRVHTADSRTPSPFASALLFSYVANYIYDGDAPLAERRAQALSIDQDQLREFMGDADLRELLDINAIEETEEQLQCVAETYRARNMDGVHDLLLRLGDLTRAELRRRCVTEEVADTVGRLMRARRVLEVQIAGEKRLIAVEDAARYRDALGVPLPPGLPSAFLQETPNALVDLVRRFARTHGPFTTQRLRHDLICRGRVWRRCCSDWCRAGKWWRVAFGPVAFTGSGATTRCCGRFGGDRWRGCVRKSSRLSRERWRDCLRGGRAWCSRGAGWMRCWT